MSQVTNNSRETEEGCQSLVIKDTDSRGVVELVISQNLMNSLSDDFDRHCFCFDHL